MAPEVRPFVYSDRMTTGRTKNQAPQPRPSVARRLRHAAARGVQAVPRGLTALRTAARNLAASPALTRLGRALGAILRFVLRVLRVLFWPVAAAARLLARGCAALGRWLLARFSGLRAPGRPPSRLNRFELARLRRASWRTRILALAGTGVLVVAALLPVVTGRTTPRWYRLEASKNAVERASDHGADAWAPEPMRAARAMLQVALVEHRHQELRFFFLRDFTQAEALLRNAEEKAERADKLALVRRGSARNTSQEAITRAAQTVGRGVAYAAAMNLGAYDRRLLQKSRLRLQEAEILHAHGRYDLATARARDALTLAETVSEHASQAAARFKEPELVQNWRRWIDETIEASRRNGQTAIIVYKEKHQLTLYKRGKAVHTYAADMGYNSIRTKSLAGDLATPEGRYRITEKKGVGRSAYHMALLLDYPNDEDRRRFAALKRAKRIHANASLGSLIEIHGEGGRGRDWTKGCVALSNDDMEHLYAQVAVGTPVTIVGGDGNGGTFTRLVDARGNGAGTGVD